MDLLRPEDWEASFGRRLVDAFLCEHVWEHLTEAEGRAAAGLCYRWLKPGGYLRCSGCQFSGYELPACRPNWWTRPEGSSGSGP
ncbi:hypothetical protein DSCO28_16300 [Desulfosarcina ovata subsp. sediminis]|uniref:Methyltransferase type 11 domain-containing protein n=1 Tax=Desulfosarcina ovata subsp. sediminis TaxID=885957 RepID=A0A5K7ZI76_9BACT|nr:hypothetical protein DSCO28_16300 [Desulfosarcina ovata subsp. sediminis]